MPYALSPALLVPSLLVLSACIPSIVVGDSPQDETTAHSSTTPGSTTAPDLPTGDPTDGSSTATAGTTDEPVPGVCGDGVVNGGEACDDGDGEPNDGCDAACTRSGEVVWTVERDGEIFGFAVAADGTIYVSGIDPEAFLAAFAPDGSDLWQIDVGGIGPLAIDAAGQIYMLSKFSGVLAFAPDSTALWHVGPDGELTPNPPVGIDVGDDALYIANYEPGAQERVVVRRLDPGTGAIVWEAVTPEGEDVDAQDLAVVGERIFVVGKTANDVDGPRPMLATFDTAGALLSLELDEPIDSRRWNALDGLSNGDLVLAGQTTELGLIVRRLHPDQSEQWSNAAAGVPNIWTQRVIAGPGDRIAAIGSDIGKDGVGAVNLHDGDGALLWSSKFSSPEEDVNEDPIGVGFGPGVLVAGGNIWTEHENNNITTTWWLRGFALD
ncbi:PQQ-binding-like beta-propeller repeat protein [Nannocystis sp. ILAH1]|uniref:outer membrane protein assembly factor BamB family protein n=1 Tax=Nannocystis sp. ILAH1 TaxID=2996789 RepID=UPI00226FAFB9|nr:PQQ-binding-like beta-propeller repeat protein [Nannocystis sp. ILAH1]MCY0991068.1 PQQ-binding-like beta-propeller repeat protein [Nannocystis sp. ILAH1]